ncbi:MAG: cellobiose phosphorylase [Spartobacteria bacterium]|nr:cellobiose phosphorylase [Spartobacteria bacterium]
MVSKKEKTAWWHFTEGGQDRVTGEFVAEGFEHVDRLYYPLCNEAGMRSSTTPRLQGSPTRGQNQFLGIPLSSEDLPHTLAHRDFWLTEGGETPFSLAGCSPEHLTAHLGKEPSNAVIQGAPGWFSLERADPAGRFTAKATLWCPADIDEPMECMLIEITNATKATLLFDPYAAYPVFARSADNLRDHRHVTALLHRTSLSKHGVTVCPTMSFDERGHRVNTTQYTVLAFGPNGKAPKGIWGAQEQFLGSGGNYAAPKAVWNRESAPRTTPKELDGREAIGGFRFSPLRLAPGKSAQYLIIAGISTDPGHVSRWERLLSAPRRAEQSLEKTKAHWQELIHQITFETPDADMNNWLTWVGYQPILRRIYGNSFLPEFDYGRGGKGWRDLWQDCLALLLFDPKAVRGNLLDNFAGVRIDGSNATIIGNDGGFLADRNNIPRTWMDHGVWPTHTTLLYVDQTGDFDFLLEKRPYFRDPQLFRCKKRDPHWTEVYGNNLRDRRGRVYTGTILEHMLIQNVTAFFNVGAHNVCSLEGADWNDGMDMAEEKGESVAFSCFYAWNLERLADLIDEFEGKITSVELPVEFLCLLDRLPGQKKVNYASWKAKKRRLDDFLTEISADPTGKTEKIPLKALADDLRAKSKDLSLRIRKQEWVELDGNFSCFNGYYDNKGLRVAQKTPKNVKMTLTGQVFPLMSGIADEKQVKNVIKCVKKHLKNPKNEGIRLNTDFGTIQPDLGRAFSFQYGEKENGAVFSHMAVMYAYALYMRDHAEEGRKVWKALFDLTMNTDSARILPCVPEYFNAENRGMYCYLTGSASWLIYLLLIRVFGIRGNRGDLVLDPQLTPEDFGKAGKTSVFTCFAGKKLQITYKNSQKLTVGAYKIGSIRIGTDDIPHVVCSKGAALITRETLDALPSSRRLDLDIELTKKLIVD